MTFNKTISLEPIVMRSDLNLNCAGIRMTIGKNKENFTDLTVDKYMGLLYIVESFNMQMAAMTVLSYMGRSEGNISSNVITTGTDTYGSRYNSNNNKNGKPGRFVGDNKSKPGLDEL